MRKDQVMTMVKHYWRLGGPMPIEFDGQIVVAPGLPPLRRVLFVAKRVCIERGWLGY
jgi:hypothetical protein